MIDILVSVGPLAFIGNWLIYRYLLTPLVKRAKSAGQLEVDSILATFGMSFVIIGVVVSIEGGFFVYKYLSEPIDIFGSTTALNRFVAFLVAVILGAALYLWLNHTRAGVAVRAVSVSTEASGLVGINVPRVSALAFALGLVETAVATLIDPGLTLVSAYLIFLLVLLFRPQGLFGRRAA